MKSTCSKVIRRTLGVAGFLIGFGLLSAGVASADEGGSPGLLGGVADLVAPVTDAVAPVVRDVTAVADPVVRPALAIAEPVTEPVLAPLAPAVDTVTKAVGPVVAPLHPVTAPLLAPVADAVQDVPVVHRAVEPLVAKPSAPAEVAPPPVAAPVVPEVPAVPPVETRSPAPIGRVAVVPAPQPQEVLAPDVAPPVEAPQQQPPEMPFALPGATGSAASSGSAGQAVSDLPAVRGDRPGSRSLLVITDHQVHGSWSWCYYYGRNHPS